MSAIARVEYTYHPDDELGGVMYCCQNFEVKEKSRATILTAIKQKHTGSNHQIKSIKWQKSLPVQIHQSGTGFITKLLNLFLGR